MTLRPPAIAADIDQVDPFGNHPLGLAQRVVAGKKAAAVGKRIGSRIEDAHHERAFERQREAAALERRGDAGRNSGIGHGREALMNAKRAGVKPHQPVNGATTAVRPVKQAPARCRASLRRPCRRPASRRR